MESSNQVKSQSVGVGNYAMKGKVIAGYEIVCKLGEGSFGVIYKVRKQLQPGEQSSEKLTTFVLKEIKLGKDENKFQSSLQEVQVLRSIAHSYIVKYIDSFTQDGCFYLVMEFCEKGDLNQYISRFAESGEVSSSFDIPEWRVWKILIQILLALEHIHEKGVIHADLKPQNILLKGKDYDIRLADFGISQILSKNYKFVHQHIGTLYYCSPEVCRSLPFNQKTDIWALGCIIYEICTRRKAFDGVSEENLKSKIIKFDRPSLLNFSDDLKAIYDMCMIKDPELRPEAKDILRLSSISEYAQKLQIPIGARHSLGLLNFKSNNLSNVNLTKDQNLSSRRSQNDFDNSLEEIERSYRQGRSQRDSYSMDQKPNALRYSCSYNKDDASTGSKEQLSSQMEQKDKMRGSLARNVEVLYFKKQNNNSEFYKDMLTKMQREKQSGRISPMKRDNNGASYLLDLKRQPDILIENQDSFNLGNKYEKKATGDSYQSGAYVLNQKQLNEFSNNKSFESNNAFLNESSVSQNFKDFLQKEPLSAHDSQSKHGLRKNSSNVWSTIEEGVNEKRKELSHSQNHNPIKLEENKKETFAEMARRQVRQQPQVHKSSHLRKFQKEYNHGKQLKLNPQHAQENFGFQEEKFPQQSITPFGMLKPPLAREVKKKQSLPLQ